MRFFFPGLLALALLPGRSISAAPVWTSPAWNGRIDAAAFASSGSIAACRLGNGTVAIRDLAGGATLAAYSCAPYAVASLAVSADGDRVAWADTSGRLFSWSSATGLVTANAGKMAVTGMAMNPAGSVLAVSGSGYVLSLRNAATLQQTASRTLNAGQTQAVSMSDDGSVVVAGDHSGKVFRAQFGGSTSTTSKTVSSTGIRGVQMLPGGSEFVAWNEDGMVWFLNLNLGTLATVDLAGTRVTAACVDAAGGRILFGAADGRVLAVSLAQRSLSGTLAGIGAPVVGILRPSAPDMVKVMTDAGDLYAINGGSATLEAAVAFAGEAAMLDADLSSGTALVLTSNGAWHGGLADGVYVPVAAGSGAMIPAGGILHAAAGPVPVYLVLDDNTLRVLSAAGDAVQPFTVAGWTPTVMVCAVTAPRLALLSAAGEFMIVREEQGVLVPETEDPLDLGAGRFWSGAAFVNGDRELLLWGEGAAVLYRPAEASDLHYALPIDGMPQAVALLPDGQSLACAIDGSVYQVFPDATPARLLRAFADGQVLAVRGGEYPGSVSVWTRSGTALVRLSDGALLHEQAHAFPHSALAATPGGPFYLGAGMGGPLQLFTDERSPVAAAFPALAPAAGGGMDSGWFGHLDAAHGAWLRHRAYGWGFALSGNASPWLWFPSEGWISAQAAQAPFLFSAGSSGWLYSLLPDDTSEQVFDYAVPGWRFFTAYP